jgi:hypothetical protein
MSVIKTISYECRIQKDAYTADWRNVSNFKSYGREVSPEGRIVDATFDGECYRVFAKKKGDSLFSLSFSENSGS